MEALRGVGERREKDNLPHWVRRRSKRGCDEKLGGSNDSRVWCAGGKQMFERDVTWRAFAPCHICRSSDRLKMGGRVEELVVILGTCTE